MAATTHEHDDQPNPGGVRRKPILAWTILAVLVVVGLIVWTTRVRGCIGR